MLINYNMVIWVHSIDLPLPISCVWVMYWQTEAELLFIWHPSEVGLTPYHTQIIPSQARGFFFGFFFYINSKHTLKTTWNRGCIISPRPPRVNSFCCCLRQSSICFSHSFMNSYFMYISQQVSNPRGPGTGLHYSPVSRHPSESDVPLYFQLLP